MLDINKAVLVVVDVQGKLAELMYDRALLFVNLEKTVRGAKALGLPILWMEQNPARMGRTIARLCALLEPALKPIPKMSFSCCGEPKFVEALKASGRKQVLLCGIESHVCLQQTAADLVAGGYETYVIEDAVSSRTPANRQAGLALAAARGALLTTVEAFLFELMRTAEHPAFKEVRQLVK